jgi:FkbM family methyltransferase
MTFIHALYRKIFARQSCQRFNERLLHLSLHGLGILNFENDAASGEHHLIHKWLPNSIQKANPIFFDVGANVGLYSESILRQFPTALIHAFEPHPGNYTRFLERGFPSHRVKCHNIALGESQGSAVLYDRADHQEGSTHASLHEAVISQIHHQDVVAHKIDVETLDDIAQREDVQCIDFLKIDAEGHEFAVLKGAVKLLEERRIDHIQFEFNEMNVVSRSFFWDFRQLLGNYVLYRLLPAGLLELRDDVLTTEIFAYQNILAVAKNRCNV